MTPAQLEELRNRATRPRRTVPIVLDGSLRERVDALEARVGDGRVEPSAADRRLGTRTVVDPVAQAELDALYERVADSTLHVVVEGLPGTPWRALLAAHPPRTGEDGKIVPDDAFGANEETFRDPLLQATIIGHRPDPDVDDVAPFSEDYRDWLIGFVTDRQKDKLVSAAIAVSRGDDAIPLPQRRSLMAISDAE